LHVKEILFSYERMSSKTRFEEELKVIGNGQPIHHLNFLRVFKPAIKILIRESCVNRGQGQLSCTLTLLVFAASPICARVN